MMLIVCVAAWARGGADALPGQTSTLDSALAVSAFASGSEPAGYEPDPASAPPKPILETKEPQSPPADSARASYTGAAISAFIPGGGQIYRRRYFLGGFFLAAEATAAGMSAYWFGEIGRHSSEASRMRDSASVYAASWSVTGDEAALRRSSLYAVIADRSEFEAREARFTAYNALSWAAGIHLYSFMDALAFDGIGSSIHGRERDPTRAGLLAAIPFLGLGQLYNGRPGKAGMISMAQISLAVMAGGHHALMNHASVRYNEMNDPESPKYTHRAEYQPYWQSRYDSNFSRRNTYLWVSLFTYLYSIFDAVVDAHLSDYDAKIDVGVDLAAGRGGAVAGATLTYRF